MGDRLGGILAIYTWIQRWIYCWFQFRYGRNIVQLVGTCFTRFFHFYDAMAVFPKRSASLDFLEYQHLFHGKHDWNRNCTSMGKETRWWFQIFFMFIPIWGNDPIWLIFFRWVAQPPTRKLSTCNWWPGKTLSTAADDFLDCQGGAFFWSCWCLGGVLPSRFPTHNGTTGTLGWGCNVRWWYFIFQWPGPKYIYEITPRNRCNLWVLVGFLGKSRSNVHPRKNKMDT